MNSTGRALLESIFNGSKFENFEIDMERIFGGCIGRAMKVFLLVGMSCSCTVNSPRAQTVDVKPAFANPDNAAYIKGIEEVPNLTDFAHKHAEDTIRTKEYAQKLYEDNQDKNGWLSTDTFSYLWHKGQQFVPLLSDWRKYDSYAQGGWMPGSNMASQMENLWLLPPQEREAKIKEKYTDIKSRNPLDAQDWIQNVQSYSTGDARWGDIMSVAKPLGLAAIILFLVNGTAARRRRSTVQPNSKKTRVNGGRNSRSVRDAKVDRIFNPLGSAISDFKRETEISWTVIFPVLLKVSARVLVLANGFASARFYFGELVEKLTKAHGDISRGLMGMTVPAHAPEDEAKTHVVLWKIVNELLASGIPANELGKAMCDFAISNAEWKVDRLYAIAIVRSTYEELQNGN